MEELIYYYRDKLGRGQDRSLGSWAEKCGPEQYGQDPETLENDDIGSLSISISISIYLYMYLQVGIYV